MGCTDVGRSSVHESVNEKGDAILGIFRISRGERGPVSFKNDGGKCRLLPCVQDLVS